MLTNSKRPFRTRIGVPALLAVFSCFLPQTLAGLTSPHSCESPGLRILCDTENADGPGHRALGSPLESGRPQETKLVEALRAEMETVFAETPGMVDHTMSVYRHALDIHEVEGGDSRTVAASALLHAIGIPRAREVHGSSAGSFQEMEGPPICLEILTRLAFPEEGTALVCGIVANHHTAHDPDIVSTMEFRILWDADWLVNFPRRYRDATTEEKASAIREIFRTDRGREMAGEFFLR